MQKIVYATKEFLVNSLNSTTGYQGIETLDIEFNNTVSFTEVQEFYDTSLNPVAIEKMEVYTQVPKGEELVWELQGIHTGYTKPTDISVFNRTIKAKIERELAIELVVKKQKEELEITQAVVDELMINGGF